MDVEEVAEYLSLHPLTVRRLVRDGEIPGLQGWTAVARQAGTAGAMDRRSVRKEHSSVGDSPTRRQLDLRPVLPTLALTVSHIRNPEAHLPRHCLR